MRATGTPTLASHPALPGVGMVRLSWPLVLGAAVYLYGLAIAPALLADGDTLWHIATGRWILEHGAVPVQDPFSHTMRGAAWTAHEWLAEVLLALAYGAGGFRAVTALTAAAFALSLGLLARILLRWLEPIYVLLCVVLAVFMTGGHLLVRPHVLAMPLLLLWAGELVRARATDAPPRLWMLPAMTLWANLHGGFTLGLGFAAAFAAEAVIEATGTAARKSAARGWGLFLVLATAAALLTPHGPDAILFTWRLLVDHRYALDMIGEWRSPDFHQPQVLEVWLLGLLALLMQQGLRVPPVRAVLLLLLVHLSLRHARNGELLGLLGPIVLAPAFGAHCDAKRVHDRQCEGVDRLLQRFSGPASPAATGVVVALMLLATLAADRMRTLEPAGPAAAVRAARAAHLTGPVLNSYGWGGYLIHEGIPPFIDGRADMYGEAMLRQYVDATSPKSAEAMHQLLDRYRIDWTLLEANSAAIALLDLSPGWHRVYADDRAVVHARNTSAGAPAQRTATP